MQYLTASISDAVKKTGIDGFMIDWLWMPNRKATEGKLLQPRILQRRETLTAPCAPC
jgi:hypothetical protein